jgi:hypothetical protein
MGTDFAGLLKTPRLAEFRDIAIDRLANSPPATFATVRDVFQEHKYLCHDRSPAWALRYPPRDTVGVVYVERPAQITRDVCFCPGAGFFLTFGESTVAVGHTLRWRTFLTESLFQRAMIDACREIAEVFCASDGVLARDQSPVMLAFDDGAEFEEAIAKGTGAEGPVPSISELYQEVEYEGLDTWDSHGFAWFVRNGDVLKV